MRLFALVALVFPLLAGPALAATIAVSGAWIRTPPPGAPTAAGYVTLANHGAVADRLVGASSAVAAQVVPHEMTMAGGIMRMRPLTEGLAIGPGAVVALSPNGDHLMLIGLKRPLHAGEHVRIVLTFARAGAVPVGFTVRDDPPAGMAGMHM